MASELDLAWAAGFIDGEGCISLVKRRNGIGYLYYQINLNAPQIDKAPLIKLRNLFGGSIQRVKTLGNRRQSFVWTIHANGAKEALKQLLPYLVVKKGEAELITALKFNREKVTGYVLAEREAVRLALMDYHKTFVYEGSG